MKTKISYTRGGTIKVGEMDFDKIALFAEQEHSKGSIKTLTRNLQKDVDIEFDRIQDVLRQKARVNLLKNKVRFYPINGGGFYPSVTSILSFAKGFDFKFPKGYAEAGTILHEYCENWAKTGKVFPFNHEELIKKFPSLAYELSVVKEEDISLEDLKPEKVLEEFAKLKVDIIKTEDTIINKEHKYAGRRDLLCKIDGKLTTVDWKSTSSAFSGKVLSDYWQQLAAYSDDSVDQLMIVPFDRKLKGIRKPYILPKEKIQLYRELFLKKREKFEETFNI